MIGKYANWSAERSARQLSPVIARASANCPPVIASPRANCLPSLRARAHARAKQSRIGQDNPLRRTPTTCGAACPDDFGASSPRNDGENDSPSLRARAKRTRSNPEAARQQCTPPVYDSRAGPPGLLRRLRRLAMTGDMAVPPPPARDSQHRSPGLLRPLRGLAMTGDMAVPPPPARDSRRGRRPSLDAFGGAAVARGLRCARGRGERGELLLRRLPGIRLHHAGRDQEGHGVFDREVELDEFVAPDKKEESGRRIGRARHEDGNMIAVRELARHLPARRL